MNIHITNHACVRYLERALKLNLENLKNDSIKDAEILKLLCINKNELKKQIIKDNEKISNILKTVGGKSVTCKIGIKRSHLAVFSGNTVVTVIGD